MVAVRGKTGNPGVSNPKKKSSTSFAVRGEEPKGRTIAFRPPQSLEKKIDEFLEKSGLKQAEFLEQAAIAYLEKSLDVALDDSEQGQLSADNSRAEEPAAATSDETPASRSRNTGGEEDQASDTKTSSKGKTRPRTGTKTRKATTG